MINREEFEELYYAGLSPRQNAEKLGFDREMVYRWMSRNGYTRICPANDTIAREMHAAGSTDIEIAMKINCNITAVSRWRSRNKLRKNPAKRIGRPRKEAIA